MARSPFVRAHNTITGAIQRIPRHWLEPGTPFAHFKPLPSARDKRQSQPSQATPDTAPAPGTKATAKGRSANTTKEK